MSEHVEYSDCMKLFDKEHYSNAIECFKKVNENDSSYIKVLV